MLTSSSTLLSASPWLKGTLEETSDETEKLNIWSRGLRGEGALTVKQCARDHDDIELQKGKCVRRCAELAGGSCARIAQPSAYMPGNWQGAMQIPHERSSQGVAGQPGRAS